MSPIAAIGGGDIVAPPRLAGVGVVLGVASGPSFHGACSLVVRLEGQRKGLRLELSAEEGEALADVVLPGSEVAPWTDANKRVHVQRDDATVLITIGSLRFRVSGEALLFRLYSALYHRTDGHQVAAGTTPSKPDGVTITVTQPDADLLGIHPGLYQALIVDRRYEDSTLVVVFDVLGDAGSIVGRLRRRYQRGDQ